MTRLEYKKCEKLMEDAIQNVKQANEEYAIAMQYSKDSDLLHEEIERRKADQHYGYAEGINQVLATFGFKHDRMKELSELL